MQDDFPIHTLESSMNQGLTSYLRDLVNEGKIGSTEADLVSRGAKANIMSWLLDDSLPALVRKALTKAIVDARWRDLTYAFWQNIIFGTGGIRGRIVLSEAELNDFAAQGLGTPFLKGTNTINEITIMTYTTGVANWMRANGGSKVVVGSDSRLHGSALAELVAKVFLARELTVYLFDEPCPYPELSFAVTNLRADVGIEISASHNDKRYNGYKISNKTGASLSLAERQEVIDYTLGNVQKGIKRVTISGLKTVELSEAHKEQLYYLGGDTPVVNTQDRPFTNMHKMHREHVESLILDKDVIEKYGKDVRIGYCAFYGVGFKAVPRLFPDTGFPNLKIVTEMNRLDGYFPRFKIDQVVDPGDSKPAELAVRMFVEEYGEEAFRELDMMVGTDPDADRMGLVVPLPEQQKKALGEWKLLTADDVWTLLLWYRLKRKAEMLGGRIPDASQRFIVKNHVTTESLRMVAKKFGLSCVDSWVGFGLLAEKAIEGWERGEINEGLFEESNGFSLAGARPLPNEYLGRGGHTLEKDGTLAAILMAEVAAYGKSVGLSIVELLDRLYLDHDIGYVATLKLQIPEEGVFEGVEGEFNKRQIIRNTERVMLRANSESPSIRIANLTVAKAEAFRTGKYDMLYWPGFPDEGIRFHFDRSGLRHVTVRPSGTEAKLRIMIHYKMDGVTDETLIKKKVEGGQLIERIGLDTINLIRRI